MSEQTFQFYLVNKKTREVDSEGQVVLSEQGAVQCITALQLALRYSQEVVEETKGRVVVPGPGNHDTVVRPVGHNGHVTYSVYDEEGRKAFETYGEACAYLKPKGYTIRTHYSDGSETWRGVDGRPVAVGVVKREQPKPVDSSFLVLVSIGGDDWPVAIFGSYEESEAFANDNYVNVEEPTIPQDVQDEFGFEEGRYYNCTSIVEFQNGRPVKRTVLD